MIKREIVHLASSIRFFTRIKVPFTSWMSVHDHGRPLRYFSFVGYITGMAGALILFVTDTIIGMEPAIILFMLSSIWVTGAFHEDGFADVCDGFGGGWTKEKILEIMKDSRLGTYGVTGLIVLLLYKFFIIKENLIILDKDYLLFGVLAVLASALSRFASSSLLLSMVYVRAQQSNAKSKTASEQFQKNDLIISGILGLMPLFALCFLIQSLWAMLIILPLVLLRWIAVRYFKKWIGGYTGDCLGAIQQISEIIIFTGILIVWKFT